MDGIADDAFETVAISWSQPEAAVILSMFAFYGIPAFGVGRWHVSVSPIHAVALQGIPIRVAHDAVNEALDLLAEATARPGVVRPYLWGSAYLYRALIAFTLFLVLLAVASGNPWFALIGGGPLILMLAAPPPTRTAAVFLLWKRGSARAGQVPVR